MFKRIVPLFDKAGAEGSGGGGDGGGGKAAESKITDEMRAEIGGLISGALKSEGARMVAKSVKDALEGLKLSETIAVEVAKLKPAEPEQKPDKDKPDPKVSALEAQLAELKRERQADAEALKREKEAGRDKDAMAALRSALAPHVIPERLDVAVRDLFVGQKRVSFDDQGNPLMTVRRAPYSGAAEEDIALPLSDGAAHWLKTNDAKMFLPAAGGGGEVKGGAGPKRAVTAGRDGMPVYEHPATTDDERARRASEREQAYRAKFPDLT